MLLIETNSPPPNAMDMNLNKLQASCSDSLWWCYCKSVGMYCYAKYK